MRAKCTAMVSCGLTLLCECSTGSEVFKALPKIIAEAKLRLFSALEQTSEHLKKSNLRLKIKCHKFTFDILQQT